ncbi:hypothetical protein PAHAL_4G098300 [Panicum hallii]|uniref:Uncharacterized protein n=1 Tax=Panicum hallii TaxID=206008 RepID=A0A2S3HIB9_9POAL|nr:hypothetical protein PAHAL_4G098300 [Panicum hallii]
MLPLSLSLSSLPPGDSDGDLVPVVRSGGGARRGGGVYRRRKDLQVPSSPPAPGGRALAHHRWHRGRDGLRRGVDDRLGSHRQIVDGGAAAGVNAHAFVAAGVEGQADGHERRPTGGGQGRPPDRAGTEGGGDDVRPVRDGRRGRPSVTGTASASGRRRTSGTRRARGRTGAAWDLGDGESGGSAKMPSEREGMAREMD